VLRRLPGLQGPAKGYPVTLDLRLIEPDQVADPYGYFLFRPTATTGSSATTTARSSAYKILKRTPATCGRRGVASWRPTTSRPRTSSTGSSRTGPGQLRGVTPLAPALPIFAQLRRFTQATLTAAEVAAMIAGVMESELPAGSADPAVAEEKYFDRSSSSGGCC
jgi:hypothetical protein